MLASMGFRVDASRELGVLFAVDSAVCPATVGCAVVIAAVVDVCEVPNLVVADGAAPVEVADCVVATITCGGVFCVAVVAGYIVSGVGCVGMVMGKVVKTVIKGGIFCIIIVVTDPLSVDGFKIAVDFSVCFAAVGVSVLAGADV